MFMKTKEKICRRKSLLWSMLFLLLLRLVPAVTSDQRHHEHYGDTESTYPDRSVRDIVHGKGSRDYGAAAGRE